jgi:hypothetical protein
MNPVFNNKYYYVPPSLFLSSTIIPNYFQSGLYWPPNVDSDLQVVHVSEKENSERVRFK